MAAIEVTAKKVIEGVEKQSVCFIDFGDNLADAAKKFGEEVVYSNFKQQSKIGAQAAMRRMLEKGSAPEQIVETMAAWKPGVALDRTTDHLAALKASFAGKTVEEKKAIIADLKAL